MNRAIEKKDLTQRVALYRMKYGTLRVNAIEDWIEDDADYIRVSDPVDVTFHPIPDDEILAARVSKIDREIETVRAELTRRVNELTDEKQRLLAITHQEAI